MGVELEARKLIKFYHHDGRWKTQVLAGVSASVVLVLLLVGNYGISFTRLGRLAMDSAVVAVDNMMMITTSKLYAREEAHELMSPEMQGVLRLLSVNGSTPCHHARTKSAVAALGGQLPIREAMNDKKSSQQQLVRIQAYSAFTFMLTSLQEDGTPRCSGGDFYETRLAGELWLSRPPVVDHGNGSYTVTILVDRQVPGVYNFTAYLLFDNFHGLDYDPRPWAIVEEVVAFQVEVRAGAGIAASALPPVCGLEHGERPVVGRWARARFNGSCAADGEGRYAWCVRPDERCDRRLCEGRVALLESNGWVYWSPACVFRLWERDAAWELLQHRRLFFWGDSNLQDAISNLLFFALGLPRRPRTDRVSLRRAYANPREPAQSLRISMLFNGHYDASRNGLGLATLQLNATYRARLRGLFLEDSPDALVLTAGLHDGEHFAHVQDFAGAADYAADFWRATLAATRRPVVVVFRAAVAPAGVARGCLKQANPQKMEVFNAILASALRLKLSSLGPRIKLCLLDAFDVTFPFHFDHTHSDGVHYGREPKSNLPPWHGRPHQYFVDVMLTHMLLECLGSHLPPLRSQDFIR